VNTLSGDSQSSGERSLKPVALGGLFRRRACWVPTPLGWLMLIGIWFTLAFCAVSCLYPFLAITKPVNADVLVVEGWVEDSVLVDALRESQRHEYRKTLTTGGPIEATSYLDRYGSWAQVAALTLRTIGAKSDTVEAVPCTNLPRNRTYESALAVRRWLRAHDNTVSAVNVLTCGPHARRTRLLYERALGPGITVGIIAVPSALYDPRYWWRSSKGVQVVFGEALAYLYARASVWSLR
jgi:hypothetical protein